MGKSSHIQANIHVYGPVPSRRLGFSLGVDILPWKTCTLDCIYCQLGSTPEKTIRRKAYFQKGAVLAQIKKAIQSGRHIDYITFSGSGEPTLNLALGQLIRDIKKASDIPVAVLTNGTLLADKRVRRALMAADLVIPSLDAATQKMFVQVNRPHPSLDMDIIIQGLESFRAEFKGQIWLEIMLVKNINDSPAHIKELKRIVTRIRPDRVQLNTVVRPPADNAARPLTSSELERIKEVFGEGCEIIADFKDSEQRPHDLDLKTAILTMVKRRPVTLADMSASLGKHRDEILKYLNGLLKEDHIRSVSHGGKVFYESAD